jgi:hypothetical protein
LETVTKKITASLFTLLGFAPLLFIIVTSIKQQEIHQIMKQQLETRMLRTITLAKKDANWVNEGKEILVDGRMFDVKSFKVLPTGEITFTGLYDDDETALVNNIRKNQQNENNNSNGKLIIQLFQILEATIHNTASEILIATINNNHFPGIEERLASQFITILSPPPQVS